MPTISNPYAAGGADLSIGKSLENLGNSMFGPQAAASEYAKQRGAGVRRENDAHSSLATKLRMNDGVLDTSDPEVAAFVSGLSDPRKFFQGYQGIAANRYGATDPRTSNAQVGAGENIQATQTGLGQTMANARTIAQMQTEKALAAARYQADTTPIAVIENGQAVYRPRSQAVQGSTPVLGNSEAQGLYKQRGFDTGYEGYNTPQLEAAGVNPGVDKVFNYFDADPTTQEPITGRTLDGKTDLVTGRPLGQRALIASAANPGGQNFMSPFQQGQKEMADHRTKFLANKELVDLTGRAIGLVEKDPSIVGLPGQVQKFGQNALAAARDTANYFGKGETLDQSLRNMQIDAIKRMGPQAKAIMPELYKPNISELETIHAIITYKTAAALFGQEGRDLSDRDVAGARATVGDVNSMFESSPAFLTKMRTINGLAAQNADRAATLLGSKNVTQPRAAPPPVAAPVPQAQPQAIPQQAIPQQAIPQPSAPVPQAAPAQPLTAVDDTGRTLTLRTGADGTKFWSVD